MKLPLALVSAWQFWLFGTFQEDDCVRFCAPRKSSAHHHGLVAPRIPLGATIDPGTPILTGKRGCNSADSDICPCRGLPCLRPLTHFLLSMLRLSVLRPLMWSEGTRESPIPLSHKKITPRQIKASRKQSAVARCHMHGTARRKILGARRPYPKSNFKEIAAGGPT